ncbi:MAG: WYL domain-containing protein, partial [Planctomycetota bacterium]
MARNEQLIRQHKLLQLLEFARFGRTLDEVRDDLVSDLGLTSLHTRTVRRDIDALIAAGFDIIRDEVERGTIYKLGRQDRGVHNIAASSTELIALSIGRDLLYPLVGTQYWKGIETFWNKVQEEIPESVYEHYQKFRETLIVFGSPAKSYEKHAGMLKTVNRGIVEHRVIEIDYQPIGRDVSTRQIEPYGLAVYKGSIYVVAAAVEIDDPQERLRHWKLDRFARAKILDDYFQPDAGVDLENYLKKSIGIFSGDDTTRVKIRLGKRSASYVREDPWHPDQTLQEQDDGSAILTVPAAHPREVLPEVLRLGADAEVLQPPEFRQAVADAVGQLAEKYST